MTQALPWRLAVVWRLLQDTSQVSKVTITFTPAALLLTATYSYIVLLHVRLLVSMMHPATYPDMPRRRSWKVKLCL